MSELSLPGRLLALTPGTARDLAGVRTVGTAAGTPSAGDSTRSE